MDNAVVCLFLLAKSAINVNQGFMDFQFVNSATAIRLELKFNQEEALVIAVLITTVNACANAM